MAVGETTDDTGGINVIYNIFGTAAILMSGYILHEVTFYDAPPVRWLFEWITIFIVCVAGVILNMIAI